MDFFIKQYANKPSLTMEIYEDGRNDYRDFQNALESAIITFNIKDPNSGKYIAKGRPTRLEVIPGCDNSDNDQYFIVYDFIDRDTRTKGTFEGEFDIYFVLEETRLITPIQDRLFINVI